MFDHWVHWYLAFQQFSMIAFYDTNCLVLEFIWLWLLGGRLWWFSEKSCFMKRGDKPLVIVQLVHEASRADGDIMWLTSKGVKFNWCPFYRVVSWWFYFIFGQLGYLVGETLFYCLWFFLAFLVFYLLWLWAPSVKGFWAFWNYQKSSIWG